MSCSLSERGKVVLSGGVFVGLPILALCGVAAFAGGRGVAHSSAVEKKLNPLPTNGQILQEACAEHKCCSLEVQTLRSEVMALQFLQVESASKISMLMQSVAELREVVGGPVVGSPAMFGPLLQKEARESNGLKHNTSKLSWLSQAAIDNSFHRGMGGNATASHQVAIDHRGDWLPTPSRRLGERLYDQWRSGLRCLSHGGADEQDLGQQTSLDSCHKACAEAATASGESCNFFLYGTDRGCRWEKDAACLSGKFGELNKYSIYKMKGAFTKLAYHESRGKGCNESLSGDGADYRGCQSRTADGRTCQAWAVQYPHAHMHTPELNPDAGLVDNYCRNPDGDSTIWCHTTDPNLDWAHCEPRSFFLSQAGLHRDSPQPQEVFVAIEVAVEMNQPSLLWRGLNHTATFRDDFVACLGALNCQDYQRAPVQTQYALIATVASWFGALSHWNLSSPTWDSQLPALINESGLFRDMGKQLVQHSLGTDVPKTWLQNWEILANLSSPQMQGSVLARNVLPWATRLTEGAGIRAALVPIVMKLPLGVIGHATDMWHEVEIARHWADAVAAYDIAGACRGHVDYKEIFGMDAATRRDVMKYQGNGQTLLTLAVANCRCLCTCVGGVHHDQEKGGTMCTRVVQELISHYQDEGVAVDAMAGETACTAAMLAARGGSPEIARTLRQAMLEQSYVKFEENTGTTLPFIHVADWCNTVALIFFFGFVASATAVFNMFQEGFPWSNPLLHNSQTLLKLFLLMAVNWTIAYGPDICRLLWRGEAGTMIKLGLILETPWNICDSNIKFATAIIFTIGIVGYFLDHAACQRTSTAGVIAVQPADIFQDPAVPFSKCIVVMIGIGCFFAMYMSYFSAPISMTLSGRFYWLLALVVQAKFDIPEHGSEGNTISQWFRSSTKDTRNLELWAALMAGKRLWSPDSGTHISVPSAFEVRVRALASHICNTIFRSIIKYTLPLFLAASCTTPVDFVLNAGALTFIYEFDDLANAQTYEVLGEEAPKRQYDDSSESCTSDSEADDGNKAPLVKVA